MQLQLHAALCCTLFMHEPVLGLARMKLLAQFSADIAGQAGLPRPEPTLARLDALVLCSQLHCLVMGVLLPCFEPHLAISRQWMPSHGCWLLLPCWCQAYFV